MVDNASWEPELERLASERLEVRFDGSFNGIFRTIPVEYRDPRSFNLSLRLDVAGVEDGSGSPLRYELSRDRHYRKIKIWIPDAENATRTVVIRCCGSISSGSSGIPKFTF